MFELLILTTFETARIDRRELYIYRGIIRILRIPISRTITIVSPFPRKLLRPCRVPLLAPAREIIARICIYMLERLRSRPQTPSSRTISALNSANVGRFPCPSPSPFPPCLAMLNRVSCVNETTPLSLLAELLPLIQPTVPAPSNPIHFAWSTH